jgi:hypothetical protein
MAGPYATVSNAFRQPNEPDTYVSLVIEAFNATGLPYSTQLSAAAITAYITTTYPLFAFDPNALAAQLARALRLGVLFDCAPAGYQLRPDLVRVNAGNVKFVAPGLATDTTACNYGSVTSTTVCASCGECRGTGCCSRPAVPCTACCQ